MFFSTISLRHKERIKKKKLFFKFQFIVVQRTGRVIYKKIENDLIVFLISFDFNSLLPF